MEWVEVRGKSVEVAVEAALNELGIESVDGADVEVLQEAQRGFLGMGGQDAIVRVKPRPKKNRRSRSRRGRKKPPTDDGGKGRSEPSSKPNRSPRPEATRPPKTGSGAKPAKSSKPKSSNNSSKSKGRKPAPAASEERDVDPQEQAQVVEEFLGGLLGAFGLEGQAKCRVEDDIVYADVTGSETEALVGPKGSTLQATLELCRTIVQRKTQAGVRIRLDVAGYMERRREALGIYTKRLAEQVIADGGEVMLEPMNAADRKVVHDAVSEIDGIRSFSEGEEPHRSVVVAADQSD